MNRKIILFFMVSGLVLASLMEARAGVVISEMMADNGGVLLDEDGDSPDWIELYNNGSASVDLGGWHLTDSTNQLDRWTLPSTNLAAGGFLVVFASGKDRAVAGAELHTNFKLSASGEFVGLVRPDGTTLEDGFSFSEQREDVSFGCSFTGAVSVLLLDAGAACRAHIPTSASDASGWRDVSFDDSSWLSGNTGVGYETGSGYESQIGLDVLAMRNVNESVYIRVPFSCTNAAGTSELLLKMKYDDGFVAYLNGTEVKRVNINGTPAWNSGAVAYHDDGAAVVYEEFDIAGNSGLLRDGENVLAIHGLNYLVGSSDLLFVPRLEAKVSAAPDWSARGFLENPTPGTANAGVVYEGFLDPPVASVKHGFFDSAFQVAISNADPTAEIRYTLDGSEPTETNSLYSSPITISDTKALRMKAFKSDWKSSFSSTETYIFLDQVVAETRRSSNINGQSLKFGMDQNVVNTTYHDADGNVVSVRDALLDIPTISVVTDEKNLYDASVGIYVNAYQRWERPASVELIHPDGSKGFQINAGLRIRGGASRSGANPKHSFRLFFRGEYGAGKLKYPLFGKEGASKFDKIDLRTSQNYSWAWGHDGPTKNTFLRDVFSRDASGEMGDPYTRSRYYHLYLNGEYWGLFMTEERPGDDFAASYLGGNDEDYECVKTHDHHIDQVDSDLDAYRRLYNTAMNSGFSYPASFFWIQGKNNQGEPDPSKEKLLDMDNLIDYLLLIDFTGACDNSISAFLPWPPPPGDGMLNNLFALFNQASPDGFYWIQHDCEHAMDTAHSGDDINNFDPHPDRTGPYTHSNLTQFNYFNPQTLHDKLTENAEYRMAFADRVYKQFFNDGALTLSNCQAIIDRRAAQIDRAIVANSARWGSTSLDRDTWVNTVAYLRNWFSGRRDEVLGQLRADNLYPSINPPTFSHAAGEVEQGSLISLSGSGGTIYFATNGTDPRAIGGGIAGSAYSGALEITKPVSVRARVRSSSGEWSALADAVFWPPKIAPTVTELMYHARQAGTDFLEIWNNSALPLNLSGYALDGGVSFEFPDRVLAPGEYVVVVDDQDLFAQAYPEATNAVLGEYRGDLDNAGEHLELEFFNHDLISFTYSDARNWPQAADGAGHSLVPLETALDSEVQESLNYGGNWRASTRFGGSPGAADSLSENRVVLNEIVAHTDTGQPPPFDSNDQIELFNLSPVAQPLDGYFLSDDPANPQKWAIPAGTILPAGGFLLFDEDDFHPARTNGFGIDKAGEQILLSTAEGIVDEVRFKSQENGSSLSRIPDGTGTWQTGVPTPAASNQRAAQPVYISELMYHPAGENEDLEYILVTNASSSSISFMVSNLAWRIDGSVDYDFPTGFSLPAHSARCLVPFNPSDADLIADFRAAYPNLSSIAVLGPYKGHLPNDTGRVGLERPQEPDFPETQFSWVVVDELFYFDRTPWPVAADGTGAPLVRTGANEWGAPTATDSNGNGLPDDWESAFGVNDPNADPDADGFNNRQEYISGTDPTNTQSFLRIDTLEVGNANQLTWVLQPNRTYSVYRTSDLQEPFVRLASGLTQSNYVDNAAPASSAFYRIQVEK